MESRRNGPQLSSRHDDDDDVLKTTGSILLLEMCAFRSTHILLHVNVRNDDLVTEKINSFVV